MHIILQAAQDKAQEIEQAVTILSKHDIRPAEIWVAPYTSATMWEKRREVQQKMAKPEDWIISADVDELHEFPDDLPKFLTYCEKKGVNCVQGVFIDRLSTDGQLAPIIDAPPLWEQFPVQADVICTIRRKDMKGWENGTVNIMACRGNVFPNRGGHEPLKNGTPIKYLFGRLQLAKYSGITKPDIRFSFPLRVHHFKWNQSLMTSLKKRLSTPGVSVEGQSYGNLLLEHLGEDFTIKVHQMPVKKSAAFNKLPWKMQISYLTLRNTSLDIYKRITKKLR